MTLSIITLIGLGVICFVAGFYVHVGINYMNEQEEINDYIERMEQERQEQEPIKAKLADGWRMWKIDEETKEACQMTEEEEENEMEKYFKSLPKL